MPISARHKIYDSNLPIWERTRDGIAGEDVIKKKSGSPGWAGSKYLPPLNGQTPGGYAGYLQRAKYINFSNRILELALGQLFRKSPTVIDVDPEILKNIDLTGRSFNYFSREIAEEILIINRVGVLVDFSDELRRPYLTMYYAENIINWRFEIIDGVKKLTLVVTESEDELPRDDDPYTIETKTTWKEFYLENGIYRARDWEEYGNNGKIEYQVIGEYEPKINGKPLDFIPFYFCTSNGISAQIKKSTLNEIVITNLAHYLNSADYENMLHWTGARTIITRGWDDKKPFPVGGCAEVGINGDAKFLECSSDSALSTGMKQKEEQISILGSSLITGKGRYVASAQTAQITSEGEYATLADISNALSDAMTKIMETFVLWAGGNENDVSVEYNTDFILDDFKFSDLPSLMGAVQSGYVSFEAYFYNLQRREFYPPGWTIEDERKKIQQTMEESVKQRDGFLDYTDINRDVM